MPITVNNTLTVGHLLLQSTASAAVSYSIWSPDTTPSTTNNGDVSAPLNMGTKFRSSVAGSVTGIRFYKGTSDTGTHTAQLWSQGGTLLGSYQFVGETASGWQQQLFTSSIAIAANTIYIAAYYSTTPSGYYSATSNLFLTEVDNGPLTAVSSSESANGVYRYGDGTSVPNSTFNSTWYGVDVVFVSS
jgi:Domain of unknown function (DUF4082)